MARIGSMTRKTLYQAGSKSGPVCDPPSQLKSRPLPLLAEDFEPHHLFTSSENGTFILQAHSNLVRQSVSTCINKGVTKRQFWRHLLKSAQ